MITIKEIAKECGVSIATVSNVINEKNKTGTETEKRVFDAIKKLGYTPNTVAKSLRSRKTRMIGIIVEDISHFTVPPIVESIMRELEEAGYNAVLKNLRLYSRWEDKWFNDETMVETVARPAVKELKANMADGIIYVAVHTRHVSLFSEDSEIPVVMSYAEETSNKITSVILDDENSARQAVSYLLNKGHRRIGIIGGKENNLHTVYRMRGIRRAFSDMGAAFDEELIRFGGWGKEDGYIASHTLMEKGITAVFCMADRIAGGVYEYLNEHSLSAGRDLSVMGYDDQDISEYFLPGLTTMALPLSEIGKVSARLMLDILSGNGPEKKETIKLPCKLIERDSVCPLL